MASKQPKKSINPIGFKDNSIGLERRLNYAKEILYKGTEFPKTLTYSDIDKAFQEFVANEIDLVDENGKRVPTFTLYSNQRFSEYSQTWEHTDENGNLLLNFKTINRETNVKLGENQGNYWNIPGDRYYKLLTKTVLSDSGDEYVEVYSMKQPTSVNLEFRINFVTNTVDMVNKFNEKINKKFKSRQCYIRPNGHYVPMVLDEVTDETSYSIEERKIFVQSINIKAMAYIITEDDFKISKFPKHPKVYEQKEKKNKKPVVEIEENEDIEFNPIDITIKFEPTMNVVDFDIDTDVKVEEVKTININNFRLSINGMPTFTDRGFEISKDDNIRIKIFKVNESAKASLILKGINPNSVKTQEISENVKKDAEENISINIENG